MSSTITSSDCSSVLQYLYGVRAFLERNSVGSSNTLIGKITSMVSLHDSNLNNTRQEDVFLKEKKSLDALRIFISWFYLDPRKFILLCHEYLILILFFL